MCFNANRSHLLHHHRNPCSAALQRYRPEFSPESHLSSQRAKHVHLTSCSIWQKKKNTEGKAEEVCLSYLHFSFFLLCTVITGASGLHIYKSFIGELMHCTWRKSAHFGCNYSGWRYGMVSHGKSLSVFLLDLHSMINIVEVLVHRRLLQLEVEDKKNSPVL